MPDVFYTRPEVVLRCVALLKEECSRRAIAIESVVDFSAGDGAFARAIGCANVRNYDLQPRSEGVEKRDWFSVLATGRPPSVIGFNPPFGYQCTMVKKFLAHAAEFYPDVMAVVHPFVRKRLAPEDYGPVLTVPLGADAFYNPDNGKPYSIPGCMFTIFVRGKECEHARVEYAEVPGFERRPETTPWSEIDFALCVRKKGVNCGRQVLVKWPEGAMLIDQNENVSRVDVTTLATASFHKFSCDRRPSNGFAALVFLNCREQVEAQAHGITKSFLLQNAITGMRQALEGGYATFHE